MSELISFLQNHNFNKSAGIVRDLVNTIQFQRLKDISYLSTFNLAFQKDIIFSRYDHSIQTALFLAKLTIENKIPENSSILIIIYGLLHDVGHVFFSHLGENYLMRKERFNHENFGKKIIKLDFKPIFKNYNIALPLLKNIKSHHKILLKSHFDIDTLQGISETAKYFGIKSIDVEFLLKEIYFSEKSQAWEVKENGVKMLLDFWKLKARIYNDLVYSLKSQYIESIVLKYLQSLPQLSKESKESEILSLLLKDPIFKNNLDKLKSIDVSNSFYIDINDKKKIYYLQNQLKIYLKNYKNSFYFLTRIKKFKENSFNYANVCKFEDFEDRIKKYYDHSYRIYIFNLKEYEKKLPIEEWSTKFLLELGPIFPATAVTLGFKPLPEKLN